MMVYFMPCYKNAKHFCTPFIFLALVLFISFSSLAHAASSAIHIKSAELLSTEENYALAADLDISLSPVIEDALNKGVPLTFLVEFQLSTPRIYSIRINCERG